MNIFQSKPIQRFLQKRGYQLTDFKTIEEVFGEWFGLKATNENYIGWVADCIEVLATYYTEYTPLLKDKDLDDEVVLDHPINQLFIRPNNFQTAWEIKHRLAQHDAIYGNGYLYKVRDTANIPRELIQLMPNRVEIKSSKTEYISHYEYDIGTGNPIRLEKDDIIHFKNPDTDDLVKGAPAISKILNQIEVDKYQTEYQKQFYKQGGFLGLLFTAEKLMGDEEYRQCRGQLQELYRGKERAYNIGLVSGITPTNVTHSIKEMDISAQRKLTMEEIISAFKVPKILLGQGEAVNRATAETAIFIFAKGVVEPKFKYFDDILTKELAQKDFGDVSINSNGEIESSPYFIEHQSIVPEDKEYELDRIESGVDNGWLSVNEIRKEEGLEPYPEKEYDRPKQKQKFEFKGKEDGDK